MSVIGQIEPFKKKGVLKDFLSQLSAYAKLNDIGDEKMPLLLLTYLSPEVYNELKAECEPMVVESMEFKALTEKLTEL